MEPLAKALRTQVTHSVCRPHWWPSTSMRQRCCFRISSCYLMVFDSRHRRCVAIGSKKFWLTSELSMQSTQPKLARLKSTCKVRSLTRTMVDDFRSINSARNPRRTDGFIGRNEIHRSSCNRTFAQPQVLAAALGTLNPPAASNVSQSLLLSELQQRWQTAQPADHASLVEFVQQWQQALWRFSSVGHIGKSTAPRLGSNPRILSLQIKSFDLSCLLANPAKRSLAI